MSTKKELKLLTELLNLEGVKVSSHRQYEGIGIIIQVEAIEKGSVCGRCGSNSNKLHQNRWHIIKDLSWGEKTVFLEINRRQGIDEIALVKGQGKYCAVLVDIDRAKLLMILESRTKEELKKVLLGWGEEILEGIEEVSIDLWKGYKSLVTEIMPKAQVVADRFQVMVQINKELDLEKKKRSEQLREKLSWQKPNQKKSKLKKY